MTDNGDSYTVHFRDTLTGDTRAWRSGMSWHESSEYLWGEGNYSDDCNRVLFMYGSDCDPKQDNKTYNCASEHIVIDKIVCDKTGETLYSEGGEDDAN